MRRYCYSFSGRAGVKFSAMPDGAGGSHPDPEEIDRELRKLTEEIGKSKIHEPSALERMVAARQAEKKVQRKRDSRVLAALLAAMVLIVGGGVFTWLRVRSE